MTEIIKLKGLEMEELYDINNTPKICHREKYDKQIATLREDCASKNYVVRFLVENLSKHRVLFNKVNQGNNI